MSASWSEVLPDRRQQQLPVRGDRRGTSCAICGLPFTRTDWNDRHTANETATDWLDLHAACCEDRGPCALDQTH